MSLQRLQDLQNNCGNDGQQPAGGDGLIDEALQKILMTETEDERSSEMPVESESSSPACVSVSETATATVKADEDEISGYIHNLSPLKQGKFFEFQLQAERKTVRGVCFSPPKRKRFEELRSSSSPVKIKKFRIDTKSNAEDYVMGHDVLIEECPGVNFEKNEMPTVMNISTVKSVCIGQLVTLKAKVAYIHAPKYVGSQNLRLQEVVLVDPSGNMKFLLWEKFVGSLQESGTYIFRNVRVKKDKYTAEVFLNTAMSGSEITTDQPFQEMLAVAVDLPCVTTYVELKGIDKVVYYLACYKCKKKIEDAQPKVVTCVSCHFKQKVSACQKQWYTQLVVEDVETKKSVSLLLFDEAIKKAIAIVHSNADTMAEFTKEFIENSLMDLPEPFMVVYNKDSKIVSDVSVL